MRLDSLTCPDEPAVDELHHGAHDDLACQGGQNVKAGHQRADGVPYGGGESAEQGSTRDVHPVVVGSLPGVSEEEVLRRRGQRGGHC